jgi:hypothetical protein
VGKHTVLISLHVLVEVESDDADAVLEAAYPIADQLEAAVEAVLGAQPAELGVASAEFWEITQPGANSGRCAVCGTWVTDMDQPEPIHGLCIGARIDGRLLCDEHLPADHPGAF